MAANGRHDYFYGVQATRAMHSLADQPRPQGQLLDDFQNGGSSGEGPGKGWVTWYKISKNLREEEKILEIFIT